MKVRTCNSRNISRSDSILRPASNENSPSFLISTSLFDFVFAVVVFQAWNSVCYLFTAIKAASLVRDMRSAPTNPGVSRANIAKLNPSSSLNFSH